MRQIRLARYHFQNRGARNTCGSVDVRHGGEAVLFCVRQRLHGTLEGRASLHPLHSVVAYRIISVKLLCRNAERNAEIQMWTEVCMKHHRQFEVYLTSQYSANCDASAYRRSTDTSLQEKREEVA